MTGVPGTPLFFHILPFPVVAVHLLFHAVGKVEGFAFFVAFSRFCVIDICSIIISCFFV